MAQQASTKICSKCGKELPETEFYPHRRANRIKSDASIDEIKKILKYMEEQIER